jgi:hypothetical protein
MPGPVFHEGGSAKCPHGGEVVTVSTNKRVFVSGQSVALMTDKSMVIGCTFTVPPGKPQPCVTVDWTAADVSRRVLVNGQPALLLSSVGLGVSAEQARQGPAPVVATAARVVAS